MTRGRKVKELALNNDWQKYFNQNIWAYFRIIISNLQRNSPLTNKSGIELIEYLKEVEKKIIYDVKEEEIPFKIPLNWSWTKLPTVCEIATGNKDVNEGDLNGLYPFFTCAQEPLKSNTFSFNDDCILLPGNGANVGHVNRYNGKFELYQRTYCLHKIHKFISVDFLHFYLRAFWKSNLGTQYGSGINYLRISNFNNFLFPVPPIEEQNLIVKFLKAFELNEIADGEYFFNREIETSVIQLHKKQLLTSDIISNNNYQLTQLENLNQAILQEAVQGKLVRQDPKDEPASELLKRIKAEKAKSGKKEKLLPPIKPEEIPFEIPESWVWCRLGEMFDIERGSSPRPKGDPRYFSKIKTPFHWITISDMTAYAQDKPLSDTREFLTELGTKHSRYVTTKDIIIVASGSAGRTSLLGIDGFIYDGLMSVKNIPDESMKHFLFYLFKIFEANMMKLATGATWQNINTDILKNQPVPIPPLFEQKRIVAEIEKQFAKTKQLKEHIIANQQATEQLLKALLHQAFEVKEVKTA
jgi:type I restriction enzyme S subunit